MKVKFRNTLFHHLLRSVESFINCMTTFNEIFLKDFTHFVVILLQLNQQRDPSWLTGNSRNVKINE